MRAQRQSTRMRARARVRRPGTSIVPRSRVRHLDRRE
jgi:hypothetical protein